MKKHRKLLLLIVITYCSCSSSENETAHSFTFYTEDGIDISETTGGPKYQTELFIYTKILQVRSDPENIDSLLERPSEMLMGNDGCLYISDNSRRQILQFDKEGAFVRVYGRVGRGPGEFRSISLLSVRGNTLTVYDVVLGRTTRYRTSGELIDVITIPHNMPRGFSMTAVMQFYPLLEGRSLAIERSLQSGTHLQFRATILTSNLDTLWSGHTPSLQTSYFTEAISGFSAMVRGIIYSPEPAIAYHQGIGLTVSPGDQPELLIYSEEGVLIRRIRVTIEPQPVTASERKKVTDLLDQRIAAAEGPTVAMLRAQRDAIRFAETKPAWTSMRVDDSGFYWLTIPETNQERNDAGGRKHRILTSDGRYLGDTRWPPSRTVARVSRGHLLVVESDAETGEPLPTVYSIRSAVAGFRYP